ncbi:MAG: hypothetical protein VKK04_10285 [Synechococcales bacterium]|nr:hypothetical protein [Synechococcales bacterium]
MNSSLIDTPRYCLIDESPWLEGIDPICQYWIAVNGQPSILTPVPGAIAASLQSFKTIIETFRGLQPGERLLLERPSDPCVIRCVGPNCYAIETTLAGAPVWHLFDQETLDVLLLTCHPDWECSPHDMNLSRAALYRAWEQAAVFRAE